MYLLFQISPGTFFGKSKEKKKEETLVRDDETDKRIKEIWAEENRRREAIKKGMTVEKYVEKQKQKEEKDFVDDVLEWME